MLSLLLLVPLPGDPVIPGTTFAVDAQWTAVAACPQIFTPGEAAATGVVIGVRDRSAYVLTAAHAVELTAFDVRFATRDSYPKAAFVLADPEVLARWPGPDLALVRVPLGEHDVQPLRLAARRDRPKSFPAPVWTVGVGSGAASSVRLDAALGKRLVRRANGEIAGFFWETLIPPERGRSGGPLLDADGQVIGICTATQGGSGYYTYLDEILAALASNDFRWLRPAKP